MLGGLMNPRASQVVLNAPNHPLEEAEAAE
jgi:hypothetical protein